jgi:hypothetical protein
MILLRLVSCLSILAVVAAIAADLRIHRRSWSNVLEFLRTRLQASGEIWRQRSRIAADPGLSIMRRVAYLLTLALAFVLSVTAFFPLLVLGQHMEGVFLVIHVTIAPFFALCLAVPPVVVPSVVLRAGDCRFRQLLAPDREGSGIRFVVKVGFCWRFRCTCLLSIILGLTVVWNEGQEYLRGLHGYSALALVPHCCAHACDHTYVRNREHL